MKLVDILARELKAWPKRAVCIVQDHDGEVWPCNNDSDLSREGGYWTSTDGFMIGSDILPGVEVAEDNATSVVTRAEWQAAVDALNQSELDAVLAKNEQLAAARAERIPSWNGEGLPPVGVDCEYRVGGATWFECNIRYITTPYHGCPVEVVMFPAHLKSEQTAVVGDGEGEVSFRPIRTADQVAAEEREKAIREICIDAGSPEMTPGQMKVAEKLYQAGYRKQVAK